MIMEITAKLYRESFLGHPVPGFFNENLQLHNSPSIPSFPLSSLPSLSLPSRPSPHF